MLFLYILCVQPIYIGIIHSCMHILACIHTNHICWHICNFVARPGLSQLRMFLFMHKFFIAICTIFSILFWHINYNNQTKPGLYTPQKLHFNESKTYKIWQQYVAEILTGHMYASMYACICTCMPQTDKLTITSACF